MGDSGRTLVPRRTLLSRFGIRGKVYLWGLVVLLLAFVIVGSLLWLTAGQQASQRAEAQIDSALQGFQADFDQQTQDLETLANWLVVQPPMVGLVQSHDAAGLSQYLKPWTQASIVDSLTVCDGEGIVLTRVRRDQPVSGGDSILASSGVPQALRGQSSQGLERDKFGRLQGRLIVPIRAGSQSPPIGALVLGFFLDGQFLERLTDQGLAEVAVVYQNQIAVTSLKDAQGKPLIGLPTPPQVLLAEQAARPSAPVVLTTDRGQYLFKFRPLESPAHTPVGMYGMGISLASVEERRAALFRGFELAFAIAVVCVTGASYLYTRLFTAPIRVLDNAARGMAHGDLSTSIVLPDRDELGDLGRQLDNMRQQLQQAMQKATLERNRYEAIVRCMGVAAVVTDPEHRLASLNPAAEALLRQPQSAMEGRPWKDIFSEVSQPNPVVPSFWNLEQPGGIGQAGRIIRGSYRLRAQPQVVLDVISTPVPNHEGPAGYVHIIQDVSAQEQLLRTKDEFAMNVAHELRGPLASLRAFVELLREDYATMTKRDSKLLLQALQRAVVKFQRLVENLIDIGTVQAGQFQVRPLSEALGNIMDEATSQVEALLMASEQHLELEVPDPSIHVLADRPRVVQVLVNLLTNASKYSPEKETIRLSTQQDGDFIRIQVTDHGGGISPDAQIHLFERFYRVKRGDDEGLGIGLGLALSKAIVEAHGGQIGVESQVGAGSTFWFSLPEVK
jgi:signal transduction histidine kinase/HAMP domain-containing protein